MNLVTQPFQEHHKFCDGLFADAEAAAHDADWEACARAFHIFRSELEAHFAIEEGELFPAFEAATGMTGGPTQMMRIEHAQMRSLLAQMADGLTARDTDRFSGAAETLLILMEQHNMKEENILYPMCDRHVEIGRVDMPALLEQRRKFPCQPDA